MLHTRPLCAGFWAVGQAASALGLAATWGQGFQASAWVLYAFTHPESWAPGFEGGGAGLPQAPPNPASWGLTHLAPEVGGWSSHGPGCLQERS